MEDISYCMSECNIKECFRHKSHAYGICTMAYLKDTEACPMLLRDCPFCGGKAEIIHIEDYDHSGSCGSYPAVRCTECGATIADYGCRGKWNRRVEDE